MFRVLVVDDDPPIRRMLERTFVVEGYRVEVAADADRIAVVQPRVDAGPGSAHQEEALAVAQHEHPSGAGDDRRIVSREEEGDPGLGVQAAHEIENFRRGVRIEARGRLVREEWCRQAEEKGCHIYVPSGAIAGLDGIKSASIGRIESAMLTSRKPVAALRGSKYVVDRGLQLDSFKQETVIFEGLAEEAAHAFPTKYHDKMSGALSTRTCLSLDVTKKRTTDDGVRISTQGDELADRYRTKHSHGMRLAALQRNTDTPRWKP